MPTPDQHALEDHDLISRIAQGERAALEMLYSRYATSVYSLAMFMLKQQALAEEVTQDIFLNIWLKASTYNGHRGEARSWVMSITHHRAVDVLRSRQRALSKIEPMDAALLESLPSKGTPVDEEVERNLDRERLLKALSTLPLAQQEVILMAYFQGYSQSEIAEKLQQPLGTVKTRVRLAMQKLREALKENVQ